MPVDLYRAPLDSITWADVEAFLGLGGPDENRPKEGLRVDYKEANRKTPAQVPDSIVDVAVSYANSFGGLIFVGVEEVNGVPVAAPGVERSKTDLKTTLSNKLRTGITPPLPLTGYQVGVVSHPGATDRDVGVIRLEVGSWRPYMVTAGKANRILVRRADQSVPAELSDIEALFDQRQALAEAAGHRANDYDRDSRFPSPSEPEQPYLRIWLRPLLACNLRLDRELEESLHAVLASALPGDPLFTNPDRETEWTDISAPGWKVQWRVLEDGSLGCVADLVSGFSQELGPIQMARLLRSSCSLAEKWFAHIGWAGDVLFESTLVLLDCRLAEGGASGSLPGLSGVRMPRSDRPSSNQFYSRIGMSQLSDPAPEVAEHFRVHLRKMRGAQVDLAAVTRGIRAVT